MKSKFLRAFAIASVLLISISTYSQVLQHVSLSSPKYVLPTLTKQATIFDSVPQLAEVPQLEKPQKVSFWQHDAVRISFAPAILFGASAATWDSRENIREIRNRYIPSFKHGFDDYMQYAPAAAVYGLKIGGVQGRNNWLRTAISHGTSLAIMGILVNSIKYTANVERPDGSATNSFPSGHTAMAFTNATFMHKEYGVVNPIYSVAGYTSATFTAVGRGMNNKHWVSDVLAGAGIGILSTQLGYFIIDKIYKNNGDNMSILSQFEPSDNPSFFSVKLANAAATTNLVKDFATGSSSQIGFEAGFEGAYFFSKHWGLGADFSFTSFPISRGDATDYDDPETVEEFGKVDMITQSIGTLNFAVGPYYALELSDKWLFMAKAQLGVNFGAKGKISYEFEKMHPVIGKEIDILTYKPKGAFRASTGASITYKFNDELGLSLYVDYHYTKPTIEMAVIEDGLEWDEGTVNRIEIREQMDYFATGLRLTAFF